MRLSLTDKNLIIKAITEFTGNQDVKLYLFGSRTQDHLRGGDIDLLLVTSSDLSEELKMNKHKILSAIKKNIGEQKIDLVIASTDVLKQDEFIKEIYNHAIPLK
ncbi:MAG: nucleotidyltransferase domain-containing protein [Gammaproteobacteria bacterium]